MQWFGWIVRTGRFGAARYWKVGETSPERAVAMAEAAAGVGPATAISRIAAPLASRTFAVAAGDVEELWQRKPGEVTKGQITFDTVVPDEGDIHVEGCYRIGDVDWKVYYFTTSQTGLSPTHRAGVRDGVTFQSGIGGADGILPVGTVLNKRKCIEILSELTNVHDWAEVAGPNSLILK